MSIFKWIFCKLEIIENQPILGILQNTELMKVYKGHQKVLWMIRLNQHLSSFAYKLCRGYKTTNVLSVVNI